MKQNPVLQLVSEDLNDAEKELFLVVREGDTARAIEIIRDSEVSNQIGTGNLYWPQFNAM